MILNTLIFLSYFVLLFFSILGYGFFFLSTINFNFKKLSVGICGLIGIFFSTYLSYITHFFSPHNFVHNIFFHIVGIFFFIFFLLKKFIFFDVIKKLLIYIFVYISALFISKNHEDFSYYHLPYMIQIVENKLQFGIGLFNIAFRTPSSLFYLQSTFYLPNINFYLFHSAGLMIFIFASIFLVDYFLNHKKKIYIKILASLCFVFLNITFARLGAFGTDRSGQIISFVIFILMLEYFNNKQKSIENFQNIKISIIFILYIITIKSYFFPYLAAIILLLIFKFRELKFILKDYKLIIILSIFFLIFLFINFSNSGCFLYPLKQSCFDNFSWSKGSYVAAEHYSKWYELWAKSGATPNYRIDDPENYIKLLNWVPNWFSNYFLGKGIDVTLILLTIVLIYLFFLKKNKKIYLEMNISYSVYFFLILLLMTWFYKHPDLRYGGYVLYALFIFIPFSYYLTRSYKIETKKFLIPILVLSALTFNIKNVLRINNQIIDQRELYSFKNFPFFNVINPQFEIIRLNDDSKAYLISDKEKCWATPSPCLSGLLKRKTLNNFQIFYLHNYE